MAAVMPMPDQRVQNLDMPSSERTRLGPTTTAVQRWDGNERVATSWNLLKKDPELWLDDGECYVYLYQPGQSQRGPSFRLPYELLVKADCNDLLDQHLICTWNSSPYSPSCPGGECYLFLHAPKDLSREEAFQYHIDTRNFFAWIVGAPLVGTDPISALVRLKDRLDVWRDRPSDNLEGLIQYIKAQGYCDLPEPMETSFSRKPSRILPKASERRQSLKRLSRRFSLRGRRLSVDTKVPSIQPMTTTLSAMGSPQEPCDPQDEVFTSVYRDENDARRGSSDSSASSAGPPTPPLIHSRDDSLASSVSSMDPQSPLFEYTLKTPKRSSSVPKTKTTTPVKDAREIIIDDLIKELTVSEDEW